MKKIFTLLLCIATLASNITIASDVTIGEGSTTSTYCPIALNGLSTKYSLSQQLYTVEELGATAKTITGITFYYYYTEETHNTSVDRDIEVWLMESDLTAFGTTFAYKLVNYKASVGTQVYDGTQNLAENSYTITFSTNFDYSGTKNLIVTIYDKTGATGGTNRHRADNLGTGVNKCIRTYTNMTPGWNILDLYNYSGTQSTYRPQITLTFADEPSVDAPANVTASSITRSSAIISWDAVEGADSYKIRYGTTAGSLGDATDVGNVTSYTISGLEPSTTYYYQVRTVDGGEESAWTTEAHFTTTAHTHNDITFIKWNFSNILPTAAGSYYLAHDVTLSSNWEPGGSINLCLNGKTVNLGEYYGDIDDGSTVAIYDDEEAGLITSSNSTQTLLADNATLAIHGVTITNTGGGRAIRAINHADASIDTSIDIADNTDNSSILAEYDAINLNVNLIRSWVADGYYSTLCLPFNLSSSEVSSLFGAGTELATLASSSLDGDIINLVFESASSIQAGKPYLINPTNNVINPSFNGVTIEADKTDKTTTYVDFKGTYSQTPLSASENILFLGGENTLGWPSAGGNINGMRTYFEIHDLPAGAPALRHARFIAPGQDIPSALQQVSAGAAGEYPQKYMLNGNLIIINGGKAYNILGAELR